MNYTSEEVFLYKIYYSTLYPVNELLSVYSVFTIALLRRFSVFCEILTFDWLDDVIQSTAPYFTMTGFTQRLCNNNIFVLFGIIKYLLTGYSGDSKFTVSLPCIGSYLTSRGNNELAIALTTSS